MRRTTLLLIIIALLLPQITSAQMGRWSEDEAQPFEALVRMGKFRPFIEVDYGLAKPKFEGLGTAFNTLGVVELKLGYAALDSVRGSLVSLDERYGFASYFGEDIRPSGGPDEGEISSELGRFGFGNRLGYGYGGKGLTFEMYNQNSLNWTKITPFQYDVMDSDVQAVFDRYGSTFRFGQLMEAGVKLHVARTFAVSAGLEGAVIFPRTVFWPWAGSAVIYSGVQGALQFFSESIVTSSPVIGPILHFVLKSGVSYAYYSLLKDDMHWPFDYETPLTVESFKLGATITF